MTDKLSVGSTLSGERAVSIEVTQRDRDAAAGVERVTTTRMNIRAGLRDDHPTVQAFALHAAPLREALERVRTMLFDEHAPLLEVAETINAALSPSYPMENNNGSE